MNDAIEKPDVDLQSAESGFSDMENVSSGFSGAETELNAVQEDSRATISRILSSYDVGAKLRQLRLRKKIGLTDLGKHTGLSASMISQLENGKLVPTLPTLVRLAMVFDVGLDHFFSHRKGRKPFAVVRGEERMKFPDRPGSPAPNYYFECLAFSSQEKSMQSYLAEFPRRKPEEMEEHFHEGAELIHMLEGVLLVRYAGEEHKLKAGDTVYFDSAEIHGYRGLTKTPARAIIITTLPR